MTLQTKPEYFILGADSCKDHIIVFLLFWDQASIIFETYFLVVGKNLGILESVLDFPYDLRFSCDVLGPVQMFTCEYKQKFVLSCLKHPYLRFTWDVLGFLWYIRASLLEIYMYREWSWACTDISLWAKRIFYGSLKPLYLKFTYNDFGSLEILIYLWTEITFYNSSNHFCKQVYWAFALAIVSKFWERKQVAGIASFDCITLWILYIHIGVQRFGNQWNQIQIYNQNP